jgi:CTP synthase
LKGVSGILVAPGFGGRGAEGKVEAVRLAREQQIPFFGICLGMQCAVIEYSRNVCHWDKANSTEFDAETPYPIIDKMEDQKHISVKGGTMRLGAYTCKLKPGSLAEKMYGTSLITERHRHRYEVNNELREALEHAGLTLSGIHPDKNLVEIIELKDHPWFLGVQFHPELKSTVSRPHPLFCGFVEAALTYSSR